MRRQVGTVARAAFAAALVGACVQTAGAQAVPSSASAAKAKELVALMKAKKIEVYCTRDTAGPGRFVAVMHVPDVQLLVASAAYSRPTDIEYYLYQKNYMQAYREISGSALGTDRITIEDVVGDGLVAVPEKNGVPDSVTVGTTRHLFEGPADPRKRNDKRMAAEPYHKMFGEDDQRYATLLTDLINEIKKIAAVAPAALVR